MSKTLSDFEKNGGTYTMVGDYYLTDLTLQPKEKTRPIEIWGKRRKQYLMNHQKAQYSLMLIDGSFRKYLHYVDEQTTKAFSEVEVAMRN